jgi:membrane-associated phospholipid phosphatase
MPASRRWLVWLFLTATALIVCYFWLDQPIAHLAHDISARFNIFANLTHIPKFLTPIFLVAFVAVGVRALSGQPLSKLQTVAVMATASLTVAAAMEDQLKFAFGRTWPETFARDNPSFIRDAIYGFNPFHGGPGFASFPSGHATAICAMMSVLWICYPRFRVLYGIPIAAVAIGLIGANYHFLSDVIAGGFLGTSIGLMTVTLWELCNQNVRPMYGSEAPDARRPPAQP